MSNVPVAAGPVDSEKLKAFRRSVGLWLEEVNIALETVEKAKKIQVARLQNFQAQIAYIQE